MTYYLVQETFGESYIANKKSTLKNLKEHLQYSYEGCEEEEIIQDIKKAISLVKNNEEIEGFYFGAYKIKCIYTNKVFTTPNKTYYDKERVYICDNDVYVVDMLGMVLDHFRRD